MTLGRSHWGYLLVIKFQLNLLLITLFLLSIEFAYGFFIQANRGETVPSGPRVQSRNPFLAQYGSMKHRAFAIQKPTTNAMLYLNGTLRYMWMWSDIKCPSISSTPRCRHRSCTISPTRVRNLPCSSSW